MTDGWQESYEVMDGGGTDDEFWAMRSEVKGECGTVGFATFEGYDDPTSSRREPCTVPAVSRVCR